MLPVRAGVLPCSPLAAMCAVVRTGTRGASQQKEQRISSGQSGRVLGIDGDAGGRDNLARRVAGRQQRQMTSGT